MVKNTRLPPASGRSRSITLSASLRTSGWISPSRVWTCVSTNSTGTPSAASWRTNSACASSKRRSAARTQYQMTWICSDTGPRLRSSMSDRNFARIWSPSWPTSMPSESYIPK